MFTNEKEVIPLNSNFVFNPPLTLTFSMIRKLEFLFPRGRSWLP